MTDSELLAIVESAERNALGWGDGELNHEREKAIKYYNGEPYGNEVEGRSQVMTTEVADTVEWILPSLLKIFTASDKAVEFEPERPNDEMGAKQATDACNYVFYRQNNGFLVLHTMFKDALLTKTGYVKVYYEESERKRKEMYRGLTESQLAMLTSQKGVEVIAGTSYPDPSFPGTQGPMQEGVAPEPPPNLYDVQVEITEPYGKTCVEALPPEEVLVSKDLNSVDPRDTDFIAHRSEKTVSYCREMGWDVDMIPSDESNFNDITPEAQARDEFEDSDSRPDKLDPSMRRVWVTEAYIKVDFDGDGKAELRKVIKAGNQVFENEEIDVIPIAAITPTIMSHRHFGKSVADAVMDLQVIKSTLLRQTLDNIYFSNAPRQAVLSNASNGAPLANLDDLLTVRPNGIVREYAPNAVRPLVVPFIAKDALGMMEYIDQIKDARVGFTGQFAGLDPNSLNKTARGAQLQQANAMQKIELIARVFAETGVKRVFQLILHCLTKYGAQRPLVIRLRDQWTDMNPSEWNAQMDMVVNVGLGTGDKDQQLIHLQSIAMAQLEAIKAGGMGLLITPKNLYNAQAKIVENAGFKNVEDFWTDPGDKMPETPPDPKVEFEKQKLQLDQQRMQMEMGMKSQEHQQNMAMKQEEHAMDMGLEREKMQMEREKMALGLEHEQARNQLGLHVDQQKAELDLSHRQQSAEFDQQKSIADYELKSAMVDKSKNMDELKMTANHLMKMSEQLSQGLEMLAKALTAKRKVVRDPKTGKAIGSEAVQ